MWRELALLVFGPPVRGQLPARVRASLKARETQAEILIAWIQLVLVGFLCALYFLAPKTSAGTPFQPVPWILGLYLLFTLSRLVLAYLWALPRWSVLLSAAADVLLLMVLIWSFHLQYGQPAPFYLKAPTLLYVFLFIALRALRFDPVFVITTGLVAAGSWLLLVWFAVAVAPAARDVITRDFVLYLTSNRVLIGAEVDKVIAILLVTGVLALALVRARRTLIHAVTEATAAQDLSRFVSPEVASQVTSADRAMQPGDGEVKSASVMFCDIERFSALAEMLPPADVMALLNEYFAAVNGVIERFGGVITQFQGDCMLITFNATARADPEHAASALRCAIGIQQVLAERHFGDGIVLRARCGVSTGEIVAGAVGTPDRLLFTVHGDEVNVAARLEQMNKDFGTAILATEETVRAAGLAFPVERKGEVMVRGRLRPVAVYAVRDPALVPLSNGPSGSAPPGALSPA